MVLRVRSLAPFALLVVFAGCGLTGQSSPRVTATPTVPVNPCAFTGFPLAFTGVPLARKGIAASVLGRTAPPGPDTGGGGAAVSSPPPGSPFAIAMVSPTEGWVVGGQDANTGEQILHYQGGRWVPVGTPAQEPLHAIAMVSPTEGWAVGVGGLILHYTGGAWTVAVPPGRLPYVQSLDGITMVSASEGWAFGSGVYDSGTTSIFVHFAQRQWTEVDPGTQPVTGTVQGISMVSAQEGWGVGFESLVHFQQGTWEEDLSDEQDLQKRKVEFRSVSMVSASDGWAVGYTNDTDTAVIARYCGGKWTPQLENGHVLYSVTMVSPDEGWAVGRSILHYSKGQWIDASAALDRACILVSISMDSPQDGWAVGFCYVSTAGHLTTSPVYLHYQNGAWNP